MNIYHIYYTPEAKEVSLMFWGCNIYCKGCYCKRRIYSPMLKDFVGEHLKNNEEYAEAPKEFMNFNEVLAALDELDFNKVLLEGQEASLDPNFAQLTAIIKRRYNAHITLLTNCHELPDLTYVDKVAFGIKAVTPELHWDYTGVSNENILKNFEKVYKSGKDLVVESIFIPDYISHHETQRICNYISSIDKNIPYVILPYFRAGHNIWRRPQRWEMEMAGEEIAKRYLNNVFYFFGDEKIEREVFSVFPDERLIVPDKQTTVTTLSQIGSYIC